MVRDTRGLAKGMVLPCAHQSNGIRSDGTACMHHAEVTDFHETVREDVLQESTDKLQDVEVGGTLPRASRFTVGEGDRTVGE